MSYAGYFGRGTKLFTPDTLMTDVFYMFFQLCSAAGTVCVLLSFVSWNNVRLMASHSYQNHEGARTVQSMHRDGNRGRKNIKLRS